MIFEELNVTKEFYKRLQRIFDDMKTRCYNSKCKKYPIYGGKDIKICDEWLNDRIVFYKWAINNGYKDNLTIDRINPNGNYEPENCRWLTKSDQTKNKNISIKMSDGTFFKDKCTELGINYYTAKNYKYNNNLTADETIEHYINEGVEIHRLVLSDGTSLKDKCIELGLVYNNIRTNMYRKHLTPDEAIKSFEII
jgi:hypothetical protein